MPLYTYQSITSDGKKQSGLIDASSSLEAKEKLRQMGVSLLSLQEKKRRFSKQDFGKEELRAFTAQLAQLINAGVPVYDSLAALTEQSRGEGIETILSNVCEHIHRGLSLSEALSKFPSSFDRLYCSMVRAGESVGALGLVLEKLSTLLAKEIKLRQELMTALIYPAVLAFFAFAVIVLLMGYVVPSIEGIFEGQKLNGLTAFVMSASYWLRAGFYVYTPLFALLIGGAVYYFKTVPGKELLEKVSMGTPFVGKVVLETAMARFCRTLETLLTGGLPIIDALEISRGVMGNVSLEKEMERAEQQIVQGGKLSDELAKSRHIPKLVSRMVRVGEDSGNLVPMLGEVATLYEQNVEKSLTRMLALVQPVILVIMGAIIGTVLLAILLPMTNVGSFNF